MGQQTRVSRREPERGLVEWMEWTRHLLWLSPAGLRAGRRNPLTCRLDATARVPPLTYYLVDVAFGGPEDRATSGRLQAVRWLKRALAGMMPKALPLAPPLGAGRR